MKIATKLNFSFLLSLVISNSLSYAQGPEVPPQRALGRDPTGSYLSAANETINLLNGNLNIVIPLISLPGRNGQDVTFSVAYNSKQIMKRAVSGGGTTTYRYELLYDGPTQGRWFVNNWPDAKYVEDRWTSPSDGRLYIKPKYIITAPDGGMHEMHDVNSSYWILPENKSNRYRSLTSTHMEYDDTTKVLSFKNGTRTKFYDGWPSELKHTVTDTNGNSFTYRGEYFQQHNRVRPASITDNLGRQIQFLYEDATDTFRLTKVTAPGANGQTQTYYFGYTPVHVNTELVDCTAVPIHQDMTVLSWILLPNGLLYRFEYAPGPFEAPDYTTPCQLEPPIGGHGTATTTLQLSRITYPAGGYTDYVYNYVKPEPAGTPRNEVDKYVGAKGTVQAGQAAGGATFTYTADTSGNILTTTIYAGGVNEYHSFSGPYEVAVEKFIGMGVEYPGMLAKTLFEWQAEGSGDFGITINNARISKKTNVVRVAGTLTTPTTKQSKIEYVYDQDGYVQAVGGGPGPIRHTNGNVLEIKEYDYGATAENPVPGALIRKTVNTYLTTPDYKNRHILDRITSQKVRDVADALQAETTYRYDEFALRSDSNHTSHTRSRDRLWSHRYDPRQSDDRNPAVVIGKPRPGK